MVRGDTSRVIITHGGHDKEGKAEVRVESGSGDPSAGALRHGDVLEWLSVIARERFGILL